VKGNLKKKRSPCLEKTKPATRARQQGCLNGEKKKEDGGGKKAQTETKAMKWGTLKPKEKKKGKYHGCVKGRMEKQCN